MEGFWGKKVTCTGRSFWTTDTHSVKFWKPRWNPVSPASPILLHFLYSPRQRQKNVWYFLYLLLERRMFLLVALKWCRILFPVLDSPKEK
jgi:hypothetical protein